MDVAAIVLEAEPLVLYSGAVVLVLVYSLLRRGARRDVVLGIGVIVLGFTVSVIAGSSRAGDALGGAAGVAVRRRAGCGAPLPGHGA